MCTSNHMMITSPNSSIMNKKRSHGAIMASVAAVAKSSVCCERVVRFCDDNDDQNNHRAVKRRVVELHDVPLSSQMTKEERSRLWRQREDHQATCRDFHQVVRSCQASDNTSSSINSPASYVNYAEALATAYNVCNEEKNDDTTSTSSDADEDDKLQLPLDQMIFLGSSHTSTRGLESRIIPGLGGHRLQKRRELIRGVLGVQRELCAMGANKSDMAEGLGSVSQYLSGPTKKFARVLGVVDGTLALLEYAAMAQQQKHDDAAVAAASCSSIRSMREESSTMSLNSCLNTIIA